MSAGEVFAGYLLLDAWIGNTDRHHQNWGFVRKKGEILQHLAPTFEHASSLGANLMDAQRCKRLTSPDSGYQVEAYVDKSCARSALYKTSYDQQPLGLINAFSCWSEKARGDVWLKRLHGI